MGTHPTTPSRENEPAEILSFRNVTEVGEDYSGRRVASISAVGCRFERCRFDRMRAKSAGFGLGMELTEYVDCSFDGARFAAINVGYSRFVLCTFQRCDLRDFGGDHLELIDCVFTGKIRKTMFWGAPLQPNARKGYESDVRFLAREGRSEPAGYRELALRPVNEFHGNDFSGAELIDVSFRGIDLTRQRLPTGDGYLYLPDAAAAIDEAITMIGERPEGPGIEKFLRGVLGRELTFGQRQLLLRPADFGKTGTDRTTMLAFDLLRAALERNV